MIEKTSKYYHTIKFLKWEQVKYRLLYALPGPKIAMESISDVEQFVHNEKQNINFIDSRDTWKGNNTFNFLNLEHTFNENIDWNYRDLGKLWTYNLNYFDFLQQSSISKYEGLGLIQDFISQQEYIDDGMESYPISLRLINWIKFIIKHGVQDVQLYNAAYFQLRKLSARPEFHLMGNHLLENAFCLFTGGFFLKDKKITNQGRTILQEQLEEQILSDGAHFELSPMYHKIILFRLLDTINIIRSTEHNDALFLTFLEQKASTMLSWLRKMMFSKSGVPHVNDSTLDIAPSEYDIIAYAKNLEIIIQEINLGSSGYRKRECSKYEILVDVGNIGPDYIPGHAHSDTFNFILHDAYGPVIVDRGISTYEKNARRTEERSTHSHNTVSVNGKEQSEVWGGFRVARRAKISSLEETDTVIKASHDGYKKMNCTHERTFSFGEETVEIKDTIGKSKEGIGYFHFHNRLQPKLVGDRINYANGYIEFSNMENIVLQTYELAIGFNKTVKAVKAVVRFNTELRTMINIR